MKGNGLLQNFTTLLAEGCAKSVGQNAALENKPFIIGTLIDLKITHQPCRCATALVHASDNVQGTLHKKARMS